MKFPYLIGFFLIASVFGCATTQNSTSEEPVIHSTGDGGCTGSMKPLFPNRSTVTLSFKGFTSKEKLKVRSKSEHETINGEWKADEYGNASVTIMPHVKGMKSGTAEFEMSGGKCSVTIKFKWWV